MHLRDSEKKYRPSGKGKGPEVICPIGTQVTLKQPKPNPFDATLAEHLCFIIFPFFPEKHGSRKMSGLSLKRTIFHQSMTDYDFPCHCDKKTSNLIERSVRNDPPTSRKTLAFAGSDPEVFIEFKGAPPQCRPPPPVS